MPTPPRRVLPSWDVAVDAFLREKRRARCATATLESYEGFLRGPRARAWLATAGIETPADLTAAALTDLELTVAKDLAANTVLGYHRTFKTFARWCQREGYTVDAHMLALGAPRKAIRKPASFTDDDLNRLFKAARNPRDLFLMEFLLHTGLRLSEATGTYLEDIQEAPDGFWIRVRQGKGSKDRIVPMDTPRHRLSKKLNAYVSKVRPADTKRRELFLAKRRRSIWVDYVPLSPNAVKILLRRLGVEAGVPNTHAHRFRHTFAARAVANGVDVLTLSKVMGHTTLAMTQRYVDFDATSLLGSWSHRRD